MVTDESGVTHLLKIEPHKVADGRVFPLSTQGGGAAKNPPPVDKNINHINILRQELPLSGDSIRAAP